MRKEFAKKFGVSQQHISKLIKEIPQKVNLLFVVNPQSLFDSYSQIAKDKFLKECATEDEETKIRLLSKLKGIATNGV